LQLVHRSVAPIRSEDVSASKTILPGAEPFWNPLRKGQGH